MKSNSVRIGVVDLLFGFPMASFYSFLHGTGSERKGVGHELCSLRGLRLVLSEQF
jgi:hypothetical protein